MRKILLLKIFIKGLIHWDKARFYKEVMFLSESWLKMKKGKRKQEQTKSNYTECYLEK
jgi:hypothetical protein